jgi:hypothetical protein
MTPKQRFWRKVKVNLAGCWEWQGALSDSGYGVFDRGNRKYISPHRFAWELYTGALPPDGIFVCHKCDNRKCVRKDHLFLGTQSDNMRDCRGKGRMNQTCGERHAYAKLTNEQVLEIRNSTESCAALGRRFGVTAQHVGRLKKRGAWVHL